MGTRRIPAHATLAFKGVIYEVWQWQQEMFDGSYQTFEGLRRPDTAFAIATVGDRILVQEEEQPDREEFLSIPGGRCDEGEDPRAAAERELREETGYVARDWELFEEVSMPGKVEWTVYIFLARDARKELEPHLDAGERISPRLVTFEEFLALADDPRFRLWELREILLRARLTPEATEAFRARLFGA